LLVACLTLINTPVDLHLNFSWFNYLFAYYDAFVIPDFKIERVRVASTAFVTDFDLDKKFTLPGKKRLDPVWKRLYTGKAQPIE
jgi:hypothetical protein